MSARPERLLDVAHLPEVTFGAKSLTWWGTIGFMIVEGMTLAVSAVSYLYLRQSAERWPPPNVPLPELLVPTVSMVVLLLVIVPMQMAGRAARRLDVAGVKRGLVIGTLLSAVCMALRVWEFTAFGVRWDDNAYGSAAWTLLGFHAALLAVDVLETGAMAALFLLGHAEAKHFPDVEDAALYQWFLSLSYVPVWALLFLLPRWI